MTPHDFGLMTPLEFAYALTGFYDAEKERKEELDFYIRRVCFYAIVAHIDKDKSGIKKESDMWPHSWDEEMEKKRRASLKVSKVDYYG